MADSNNSASASNEVVDLGSVFNPQVVDIVDKVDPGLRDLMFRKSKKLLDNKTDNNGGQIFANRAFKLPFFPEPKTYTLTRKDGSKVVFILTPVKYWVFVASDNKVDVAADVVIKIEGQEELTTTQVLSTTAYYKTKGKKHPLYKIPAKLRIDVEGFIKTECDKIQNFFTNHMYKLMVVAAIQSEALLASKSADKQQRRLAAKQARSNSHANFSADLKMTIGLALDTNKTTRENSKATVENSKAIGRVDERVTNLGGQVTVLGGRVTDLEGQVNGHDDKIHSMHAELEDMRQLLGPKMSPSDVAAVTSGHTHGSNSSAGSKIRPINLDTKQAGANVSSGTDVLSPTISRCSSGPGFGGSPASNDENAGKDDTMCEELPISIVTLALEGDEMGNKPPPAKDSSTPKSDTTTTVDQGDIPSSLMFSFADDAKKRASAASFGLRADASPASSPPAVAPAADPRPSEKSEASSLLSTVGSPASSGSHGKENSKAVNSNKLFFPDDAKKSASTAVIESYSNKLPLKGNPCLLTDPLDTIKEASVGSIIPVPRPKPAFQFGTSAAAAPPAADMRGRRQQQGSVLGRSSFLPRPKPPSTSTFQNRTAQLASLPPGPGLFRSYDGGAAARSAGIPSPHAGDEEPRIRNQSKRDVFSLLSDYSSPQLRNLSSSIANYKKVCDGNKANSKKSAPPKNHSASTSHPSKAVSGISSRNPHRDGRQFSDTSGMTTTAPSQESFGAEEKDEGTNNNEKEVAVIDGDDLIPAQCDISTDTESYICSPFVSTPSSTVGGRDSFASAIDKPRLSGESELSFSSAVQSAD